MASAAAGCICFPILGAAPLYWIMRLSCCQDWFVSGGRRLHHEKQQHAASNVFHEPVPEDQMAGVYQEQCVCWIGIAVLAVCAGQ